MAYSVNFPMYFKLDSETITNEGLLFVAKEFFCIKLLYANSRGRVIVKVNNHLQRDALQRSEAQMSVILSHGLRSCLWKIKVKVVP